MDEETSSIKLLDFQKKCGIRVAACCWGSVYVARSKVYLNIFVMKRRWNIVQDSREEIFAGHCCQNGH